MNVHSQGEAEVARVIVQVRVQPEREILRQR